MNRYSIPNTVKRIDEMDLWGLTNGYYWAVKPQGTVFPYFCSVEKPNNHPTVKVRLQMLEGYQTLCDFLHLREDAAYGFYSVPAELPHYDVFLLHNGCVMLFRNDPGYVPAEVPESDVVRVSLVEKIVWQSMGVLMRLESDPELLTRQIFDTKVLARVENKIGEWQDCVLPLEQSPEIVEHVAISAELVKHVKTLRVDATEEWALDLRLMTFCKTRDPRPRSIYGLIVIDARTGNKIVAMHITLGPDNGLRTIWESMAEQVMRVFKKHGQVPGVLHVMSHRAFRMLRPMCLELPVKLTLHDALPQLEKAFEQVASRGLD